MEVIVKRLSLEPFYSRQKGTIPFVGYTASGLTPSLNWGKIAYGVDFPKLVSELGQPTAVNTYGMGVKKLGKMTFQELMDAYHSVRGYNLDFSDDLTEEEREEIEKLRTIVAFVESHMVIDEPKKPVDPCCNPCPKPEPVPEYDIDHGNYFIEPTMHVNLCMIQSANIMGAYTFATKEWVPGKRYFEGDKVIYDGKTYKLKPFNNRLIYLYTGSETNCEGHPLLKARYMTARSLDAFKEIDDCYDGLSEELFDGCVVSDTNEMVDMGYIYAKMGSGTNWTYFIRPSWGGYYNSEDGNTYFDELNQDRDGFVMRGEYDTVHWEIAGTIVSHGAYNISTHDGDVHIGTEQNRSIGYNPVTMEGLRWESKLVNFKRNTKTVTQGGIELQGKLLSTRASQVMDLQYIVGTVKNVDTTGDVPIGDYLASVDVYDTDGNHVFQMTAGQDLEDYAPQVVDLENDGRTGKIEFVYYVGAELAYDDTIENYTYDGGDKGIVYKDTYEYRAVLYPAAADIDNPDYIIEGRTASFVYIDIDYESAKEPVVYENVDNYEDRVILSDVTATTKSMTAGGNTVSPDFQNADYFMEDYQLGLSFVANNNDNVYIDRGNATAFERHMRLSEVDTLQDLENYGNGMFKLKE